MDEDKTDVLSGWADVEERLIGIIERKSTPEVVSYLEKLNRVNFVLINEDEELRPYDSTGLPGGIVELKQVFPPSLFQTSMHAWIFS